MSMFQRVLGLVRRSGGQSSSEIHRVSHVVRRVQTPVERERDVAITNFFNAGTMVAKELELLCIAVAQRHVLKLKVEQDPDVQRRMRAVKLMEASDAQSRLDRNKERRRHDNRPVNHPNPSSRPNTAKVDEKFKEVTEPIVAAEGELKQGTQAVSRPQHDHRKDRRKGLTHNIDPSKLPQLTPSTTEGATAS